MSKAEAFEVSFAGNKQINTSVEFERDFHVEVDFPLCDVTGGGGGGGSSLALEQYFGMLDALGLQPITDEEIVNTCDSIWKEIQDGRVPTYIHQSTLMASVRVNKGDSALETLFPIPETIDIYSMSNIEVTNTLSTLWETING